MKNLSLFVLLLTATFSNAQKLDFSFSSGTGKAYIFESIDKSINVNYSMPLSLLTEIKYTPKDKKWGLKLRIHNVQSTIVGENWINKTLLDGYINSTTTSLLLEKEIQKKKFSFGYNFGLGLTREDLQPLQFFSSNDRTANYSSFTFGGHLSYKINQNFDFQILPIFVWQDPFKTIGVLAGKRRANLAMEDLSMFLNFGLKYNLKN